MATPLHIGLLVLCPIRHLDCSGVTQCFAILPASVGKVGTAGEWDEFGDVVGALQQMGENTVAETIKQKYIGGPASMLQSTV